MVAADVFRLSQSPSLSLSHALAVEVSVSV